jgi:predicted regulator of Ras-like GTPase activity (Roadblock/LC7/MglB family)
MTDLHSASLLGGSRSERLDRAIHALLAQTPEIEAAAVVSFDGLPMAAALPPSMDEDRVAAMSAALLSLGERAAQGLGRGELSQVYIEGDAGTVFLVSADDEAVLVAVASKGAKVGMMLYEVRRTAAAVADVLRAEDEEPAAEVPVQAEPVAEQLPPSPAPPVEEPVPVYTPPTYTAQTDTAWSSYAPSGSSVTGSVMPPSTWS